jgi:hypothetical protein
MLVSVSECAVIDASGTGENGVLRIAGGIAVGIAVALVLYLAATKLRTVVAEEERNNPGVIVAVLIVVVGSAAAYIIIGEVLG